MAADQSPPATTRSMRSALLKKQPEIEEVDEDEVDTSPGSDQSDTTITAGAETPQVLEIGGSPETDSHHNDLNPSPQSHNHEHHGHHHNHISAKFKQLTRSEALCEDCASPPLDPLQSTASTCSTDSNSSGIGSKSQTSGSGSWSIRGRLEKEGSQSSEAGTSSSLSRESSIDTPYKDSTGIDLEDFIKKTLNKTPKDRSMLIKLEVDLVRFIREPKHHYLKFPQMSSYDRMLVHRIAAFFGLDHNVDQTGKCVIVNKTNNTRIPDFSFQDHIHSGDLSKPKMLLKRGGAIGGSFEELHSKNLQKPSLDSTRAKSLEERQQLYDEARNRIFTGDEPQPTGYAQDELAAVTGIVKKLDRPHSLGSSREDHTWSSTESSGYGTDNSSKPRILVPKANSFGGTGTFIYQHLKSPMRGGSLSKADSMNMGVGGTHMSLGSPMAQPMLVSGSPTCNQSDNSSMGSGSSGIESSPHQPPGSASVPGQGQKYYWVASDLGSIPPGSVVINPQTGQPYYNADGTPYRYMPGQPVPSPDPYPQSPQPTVYHVQQTGPDWTSQLSQESQSSTELCQQVSMMRVTPPTSTDPALVEGPAGQQPMIINQNVPQAYPQSQQAIPCSQHMFYPAAPGVTGQAVRYVCSMTYPSPTSSTLPQGGAPGGVAEGQTPAQQYQPQQYQQATYIQGYNGAQVYPATAQGQVQGHVQQQGSEVNYSQAQQVSGQGSGEMSSVGAAASGGYSYPVQYNNQGVYSAPAQSQIYYTVHAQGQPQGGAPVGYAYQNQLATVYQSGSPPSQSASTTNNNPAAPVAINIPQQAGSSVNISQQQPPTGGATATPCPSTQYISYPHQPQPAHTVYPPSYPGTTVRPVTPTVVPFPNVQTHVQSPAQTFQTVYRPNMQYPMQLQQSQQPGLLATTPQQNSANPVSANVNPVCVNGTHATTVNVNPSQHHVTVSAKGLQYESSAVPNVENGGDKLEAVSTTVPPTSGLQQQISVPQQMAAPVATTTVFRPPRHVNIGDARLIGHPQFRPQVPQPVQFTPAMQAQQPRFPSPQSPTVKAQRIKKSHSRESQNSQQSTDSGALKNSSILEVYDLPGHLRRSEADKLLSDVLSMGADVQYVTKELEANQGDYNTNNLTMSQYANVFAVFPDSSSASHMLQTYTHSQFKLRLVMDSIGAGDV